MLTRTLDNIIIESNKNTDLDISFDVCGNCYLNQNGSNEYYQININNKDEIYFEHFIIEGNNAKIRMNKLINVNSHNNSNTNDLNNNKETDNKNCDNENSNNDDYDTDDEDEDEDDDNNVDEDADEDVDNDSDNDENFENRDEYEKKIKMKQKLFPEENDYKIEQITKTKKKFSFASLSQNSNIKMHKKDVCDTLSLYSTIVYDRKNLDKFSVVFTSNAEDYVLYRLNVYGDGRLIFRPIGNINKHYAVSMQDNKPILFKI